jgi:uncharacterized protein
MKNYADIIIKYYPPGSLRHKIYVPHCRAVADLAIRIAKAHPEWGIDLEKLEATAMLHDIGIFLTDAPDIGCFGDLPYLAHGYKGRELLEKEGFQDIAPVCERHIGVGLTINDIIRNNLPLPKREMMPVTLEEKIVCFADKFFSKSKKNLAEPKPMEKVKKNISKYGPEKWKIFEGMIEMFGLEMVYSSGANTNSPPI